MEPFRRLERTLRCGGAGNPHSGSLEPQTPADMADLFGMICDDLGRRIAGCQDVVRTFALLGTRHLAGHELLRCLVIGEPGTGKTTIVEALAQIIDVPYLRISMPETPETTWGGGPDILDQVAALKSRDGGHRADASHMLLHLDDLDIVRIEPWQAYGAPDRGQREGRQRSLLTLWSGGVIGVGDDHPWQWNTRRSLIIACMEADGLPDPPLTAARLAAWGLLPPLADRFASGTVVRMPVMMERDIVPLATAEAERRAAPAFRAFGYRLTIPASVARYALAARKATAPGPRELIGILCDAADRALIELVASAAPPTTERVIRPDDIRT
jgi:hypothetical protein